MDWGADLYRLSLAHLLISQDPDRPQLARRAAEGVQARPPLADPVGEMERLFSDWIAEGAGRVMAAAHRAVQIQLGPVRRLEGLSIPNLLAEAKPSAQRGTRTAPASGCIDCGISTVAPGEEHAIPGPLRAVTAAAHSTSCAGRL